MLHEDSVKSCGGGGAAALLAIPVLIPCPAYQPVSDCIAMPPEGFHQVDS